MATSIPKVVADFQTSLDASVSVGDTVATLLSTTDTDGVILSDGYYGFTIDNDTDYKEFIVCTVTSTALSGIFSVSDQGVATTGFKNYHRRGATIEITDHVSLLKVVQTLTAQIGLDSANPLYYDDTATISSPNMLATRAYVLSVVSGGTVSFDTQILATQTAGENLTANNLVYFKTLDQRWYNTDADTTATVINVRLGIAVSTVTTGNTLQIIVSGPYTTTGLTAGFKYYASQTPGGITVTAPTSPAFPVFVGWALSTTQLFFNPAPTIDQFSGVTQTPSSTNKYLAQADGSADATDQSQTVQNGTFSAGETDATTRHNKLAQSFIPTKTIIRGVNLYKAANTGTFTGTVTVSIHGDTGSNTPLNTALATKTITNALWLAYATGDFLALFTSELTVTPGSLYWIVIETSTADTANCINLGTNTAGGYGNGSAKYYNTAQAWNAIATIDLYFKTLEGANGKAITADSNGFIPVGVRKNAMKNGTVGAATTGTAIVHGLGKVPTTVRGYYADADSAHVANSIGSYDVGNGTYVCTSSNYNEGTSGSASITTAQIAKTGATNGNDITISAADEMVVIFTSAAGTVTVGYEIIG